MLGASIGDTIGSRFEFNNIKKKTNVNKDDLSIHLAFNKDERTITITDTGCGMTKEELEKYGYRVYKKSEVLNVVGLHLENIPNRGLRLYPIKAVIVIGMMLTESEVAEQLRKNIMDRLFSTKTVIFITFIIQ